MIYALTTLHASLEDVGTMLIFDLTFFFFFWQSLSIIKLNALHGGVMHLNAIMSVLAFWKNSPHAAQYTPLISITIVNIWIKYCVVQELFFNKRIKTMAT